MDTIISDRHDVTRCSASQIDDLTVATATIMNLRLLLLCLLLMSAQIGSLPTSVIKKAALIKLLKTWGPLLLLIKPRPPRLLPIPVPVPIPVPIITRSVRRLFFGGRSSIFTNRQPLLSTLVIDRLVRALVANRAADPVRSSNNESFDEEEEEQVEDEEDFIRFNLNLG